MCFFLFRSLCFELFAYRQVVDSHAADGATVVAEVVLDGGVGHLEQSEKEMKNMKRRMSSE